MKNWIKELDLKVTEDQKKWLRQLYGKAFKGDEINYRVLRAELYNEISKDFNPDKINELLANYRGTEITILGIELLDPGIKIFDKTDKVILAIKELLLRTPMITDVKLDQIHEETRIDKCELDQILFCITRFREPSFSSGSTGSEKYRCNSLRVGEDYIFDNYMKYESIDSVIENWIKRTKDDKLHKPKLRLKQRTQSIRGLQEGLFGNQYLVEEENDEKRGFYCQPIFNSPAPKVNESLCFVLMPFKESWSDEVWSNMIRPSVEYLGLQCLRADSIHGLSIIEDIWTSMNQSAFIIADLTKVNPNVMYEMGIVHTIGKPCILITQDISNKPFDVGHLRQYQYEVTPSGANKFKDKLHEVINDIYDKNYPDYSIKIKNK